MHLLLALYSQEFFGHTLTSTVYFLARPLCCHGASLQDQCHAHSYINASILKCVKNLSSFAIQLYEAYAYTKLAFSTKAEHAQLTHTLELSVRQLRAPQGLYW